MKSLQPSWSGARLAFAITLATCSGTAAAVTFQIGEIEGQFDSNLSVGASWALRNPDPDLLHDPASDDGRRNFKKGETFSKVLKVFMISSSSTAKAACSCEASTGTTSS